MILPLPCLEARFVLVPNIHIPLHPFHHIAEVSGVESINRRATNPDPLQHLESMGWRQQIGRFNNARPSRDQMQCNRLAPTTYTYSGGCQRGVVWLSYRTSELVIVFVS